MDWTTEKYTPQENADTLGTMVSCALIESAGYLTALIEIDERLKRGDLEDVKHARLLASNAVVGAGVRSSDTPNVLLAIKPAWYAAIPRSGDPVGGF